ncbi:glycosyltransferase family 39 protein [Streptomyces sp. NPDC060028]|uniref:glycosyltransferase family 39 protein n=1 Tax=Streptomyces sp. NPDC060028 TaxID=3347041 RepID=UPI00369A2B33
MESAPPARKHPEADISRIAPWRWLPPLAAAALGLWGLERGGSMWRDESVTWQAAHRPLGGLWELLGQVDAVHGLYYLLMHGVFAVWDAAGLPGGLPGGGLWALRLPSVVATALAAAGVAAVGHRLAGERAGLIAGLAYAVAPPVQMYAQEGRSYALVAAAVVWATYLMLRERWVAYAGVLLLGCWLHEFAVLALPAHGFAARRSRGWRRSAGAVAAGLLPLALVSARQAQQQLGWLGRPSWQDWAAYGLAAAAALLLARGASAPRELVRVALPLALLPPGLLLAVSLVHPWYVDRYVLYALAGLALLAGARLGAARGPLPWLLVAALLVPFGWWSAWLRTPESRKDDVLAVAAAVRERARPGDAVLFLPSRRREWLLSSPRVYGSLRDLALERSPAASRSLQGTERPAPEIRAALLEADRVVALLDPAGQPVDGNPGEAVKRQTLVSSFDLCSVTEVRGARVAVFARPGGCP